MKNKHIISESKIGSSGLSVLFHNDVCVTLQISHVQLTKISNISTLFIKVQVRRPFGFLAIKSF
jgi:hypothetical protein